MVLLSRHSEEGVRTELANYHLYPLIEHKHMLTGLTRVIWKTRELLKKLHRICAKTTENYQKYRRHVDELAKEITLTFWRYGCKYVRTRFDIIY
jgi:hypothetical protein